MKMLGQLLLLFLVILSEVSSLTPETKNNDSFEGLGDHEIAEFLIQEISRDNIKAYLKHLTAKPHVGGTEAEWENADWVANNWREQGLDQVHLTPYDVLLSYPDKDKPNYAKIQDENGITIWKSQGRSPPLHSKEEYSHEIFPDFNAFSPPGTVQADIVFANFGQENDFDVLSSMGIDLNGKIVIAKYGKVFRGNIAKTSEERGAIGLLLYSDPQQYAPDGVAVYPDTTFMPGGAAAFGTVYMKDGDPLTPFYPSTESAFRIPEDEAAIPTIPVMPLGYDDADHILRRMKGKVAPPEWQGGLNLTYKVGPGLVNEGWNVTVEVNTHNQRTTTYNVIAIIEGEIEPDRYVVLGNHRDAWIFGAIDPSSGTAVMLELSRVFAEYRNKTGWRPKRSIVFCSWGSEEYGMVGSTEWVDQFGKQLAERAVAYLNLDMAIEGNYTLRARSAPLMYAIGREVTKMIPNPDKAEVAAGRKTVYDTWIKREPNPINPQQPNFRSLGAASDYKGFQHVLGIPCLEYRYTFSKDQFAEPLYHTLYETFFTVSHLYDRNFDFHAAISQMWGLTAAYLSDAKVLPFSLEEYVSYIDDAQSNLIDNFGEMIDARTIKMDYFLNATKLFNESVINFKETISKIDFNNSLQLRQVNDKLMMVERSFIDPRGLHSRPNYNHILMAPSESDNYEASAFSTLSDSLTKIKNSPEDEAEPFWRTFQEQLSIATHLLETAAKVLSNDIW